MILIFKKAPLFVGMALWVQKIEWFNGYSPDKTGTCRQAQWFQCTSVKIGSYDLDLEDSSPICWHGSLGSKDWMVQRTPTVQTKLGHADRNSDSNVLLLKLAPMILKIATLFVGKALGVLNIKLLRKYCSDKTWTCKQAPWFWEHNNVFKVPAGKGFLKHLWL